MTSLFFSASFDSSSFLAAASRGDCGEHNGHCHLCLFMYEEENFAAQNGQELSAMLDHMHL